METGDKIRITWTDGEVAVGFYVKRERGYVVFEDESGKRSVYHPEHVESVEVISGDR